MGWSIDYRSLRNLNRLDDFLLAVGKALFFANAFEYKCHYVLRVLKIVEFHNQTKDVDATLILMQAIKDGRLSYAVSSFEKYRGFTKKDVALLERSVRARNFIAHKGAAVTLTASEKLLRQHWADLRREVLALIPGDNLISSWVFGIEEKEPTPSHIVQQYPKWIESWVFGDYDKVQ